MSNGHAYLHRGCLCVCWPGPREEGVGLDPSPPASTLSCKAKRLLHLCLGDKSLPGGTMADMWCSVCLTAQHVMTHVTMLSTTEHEAHHVRQARPTRDVSPCKLTHLSWRQRAEPYLKYSVKVEAFLEAINLTAESSASSLPSSLPAAAVVAAAVAAAADAESLPLSADC
jgi:hypothetical protein